MRWLVLVALALSGLAFTTASRPLPRGDEGFTLATTRARVDSAIAARALAVIFQDHAHLTSASDDPAIEYEDYAFFPSPNGPSLLWRVTLAYRVPYGRAAFDSVRSRLVSWLGEPAEEKIAAAPDSGRTTIWVDPSTSVRLGARWPTLQDARVDRMLVVWTERRLQRMVEAQKRPRPGKAGRRS